MNKRISKSSSLRYAKRGRDGALHLYKAFTINFIDNNCSICLFTILNVLYSVVKLKFWVGFLVYPNTLTNKTIKNLPYYCSSLLPRMLSCTGA